MVAVAGPRNPKFRKSALLHAEHPELRWVCESVYVGVSAPACVAAYVFVYVLGMEPVYPPKSVSVYVSASVLVSVPVSASWLYQILCLRLSLRTTKGAFVCV